HVNGRNTFANCSFVVSVMGEAPMVQRYNPYVFSHTDSLAADNAELLNYLYEAERRIARSSDEAADVSLSSFIHECEKRLLYSEDNELPNAAAMDMDIHIKGYDRICMINVTDTAAMSVVFSKELIDLTYRNFISRSVAFAKQHNYSVYQVGDWNIAIAAPSYMVSLNNFTEDMKELQKMIFESGSEYIAIVPTFCVIDNCTAEDLFPTYYSARVEMTNKNMQFFCCDAADDQLDEESIKDHYHMVNVINYAIANNKIIPYFQGINDNETNTIHHYESLMRIEDENGKIYYPGDFLDVARKHGLLYDSMSKIMISKVFHMWEGITDKSVSINLSIRDIKDPEITDMIFRHLEEAPDPGLFVFEILENEDIDDYDELLAFVDKIHEYGGLISIDDFGSGYSNLQHIANINCDYLKLDGSIVRHCVEDPQSAGLIALLADWKKISSKDIRLIAEYVENQSIQDILLRHGVDLSQGYLFSKPRPDLDVHPQDASEV
ncbi:MAG: EAL domain-containing protein, partial [Oscillospiraceae bacterium]|nr:EAL domain-containing protein [Oscillospiraceae bacterium]